MKVASNHLFVLTLINCILHLHGVLALQMILSTREPHCIFVNPVRTGAKITLNYVVTGVNEEQVSFSVSVNQLFVSVPRITFPCDKSVIARLRVRLLRSEIKSP